MESVLSSFSRRRFLSLTSKYLSFLGHPSFFFQFHFYSFYPLRLELLRSLSLFLSRSRNILCAFLFFFIFLINLIIWLNSRTILFILPFFWIQTRGIRRRDLRQGKRSRSPKINELCDYKKLQMSWMKGEEKDVAFTFRPRITRLTKRKRKITGKRRRARAGWKRGE